MTDMRQVLARLESLPAERRQAVLRLLTERGSEFDVFPLSSSQRRLWFLSTLYAGVPLYNVGYGFRISGPLDVTALRRALESLVERHEMLRTAFIEVDGEPFQVILPEARLTTAVSRWDGRGSVEALVRRLLDAEARRTFDLASAPLIRSIVVQLGEEDFLLLLTLHHIVCDGWSMTVVLSEVAELYAAGREGRPPRLRPLGYRYVDYVRWESEQDGSASRQRQLRYWTEQLAGASRFLELPTDHPRPQVQSLLGAQVQLRWPGAFGDQLESFCQREGVTVFVALLAALDALLYRWTGQDDVHVGVPVANRSYVHVEGLVGVFINTVVLRARMDGATTFRELLHAVRESSLGALANQELPFEKLVEALAPERSQDRPVLFQVDFAVQDPSSIVLVLPGLTTRYLQGDTGTAKFDLTLSVWPGTDGLDWICEYNRTLFEPETVRRLFDSLRELLAAAIADPGQRLAALPMVLAPARP